MENEEILNRVFLKSTDENDPVIYCVDEDRFQTIPLSETYDDYGQLVGSYNAGDSIELITQEAVNVANKIINQNFDDESVKIAGDIISAYDHSSLYNDVKNGISNLVEDVDYHLYQTTIKGFNCWDGSNFKTVVIETEIGEPEYTQLFDEKLTKELLQAIEGKSFVRDGFGKTYYEHNDWTIVDNYCQGHWANYEIIKTEDLELYI